MRVRHPRLSARPAGRDPSWSCCPAVAEALSPSCCLQHVAESHAVPAQSHLSFAVVAAGAEAPVLGVVAGAAEEQRLLLEVALVDVLGHRRVEVVHLVLRAVAGDAEPGNEGKKKKQGSASVPPLRVGRLPGASLWGF